MNTNSIEELGFESTEEFFNLISTVDLSTADKLRQFEAWKTADGTKEELLKLSFINSETVTSENNISRDINTYEGMNPDEMSEVNALLNQCTNLYGVIGQDIKNRIINYLVNPSINNWEDIYSICINGIFYTVWRAVGNVDEDFPSSLSAGSQWQVNPSPQTVIEGIRIAVENN